MRSPLPHPVTVGVGNGVAVSALLQNPPGAFACLVLAHGAGAGMAHPFMSAMADELAARAIATLRYQFPYMESKRRRPDPPGICHATVAAAVGTARELMPNVPLFAGGKSFGGRMTSQAQAAGPLPSVRGICFLGFPLHPPGEPSTTRAEHLFKIQIPLLFLQGTRDAFADAGLLQPLVQKLGAGATLELFEDTDHSFRVPARTGRSNAHVQTQIADALAAWIASLSNGDDAEHGRPSTGG